MKKILITLLFLPSCLYAQFYVGLGATANVGINGRSLQEFILMNATVNNATGENTITEKKVSFGSGYSILPTIGYKLNQYVGIELQGGRYKTNKVSTSITYINPSDDRIDVSMSGKVFSVRPSIIGYVNRNLPLVYLKAGAVYSNCEFNIDVNYLYEQMQNTILINGGQSFGFSFGGGADFCLTKRIFIRTEFNFINANYYPKKGLFTKVNLNGVDNLPNMTDQEKTIHFVNEGDFDQNYLGASLESGTHLSPQIPISSFGLNISLIYKLNKRKM